MGKFTEINKSPFAELEMISCTNFVIFFDGLGHLREVGPQADGPPCGSNHKLHHLNIFNLYTTSNPIKISSNYKYRPFILIHEACQNNLGSHQIIIEMWLILLATLFFYGKLDNSWIAIGPPLHTPRIGTDDCKVLP